MAKDHDAALAFLKRSEVQTSDPSGKFRESFEVQNAAHRNSFHGFFGEIALTEEEEFVLDQLVIDFAPEKAADKKLMKDLSELKALSVEIKGIIKQSILLHGERILKAQQLLSNYQEGAFSRWLLALYGNRQTPYSMLHYYLLYKELNGNERKVLEQMPRKCAYMLAGRQGDLSQKKKLIAKFDSFNSRELLAAIADAFPIGEEDGRRGLSLAQKLSRELEKLINAIDRQKKWCTNAEKEQLKKKLLEALYLLD